MNSKRRVLTPEEAAKLIATCDSGTAIDLRDRALIIVGLETGMERISLAGMDLAMIANSGYPVAWVPIKGSDRLYPVPLSDTALTALEPWRAWLRKAIGPSSGPVFRPLYRGVTRGGKLGYEPTDGQLSRAAISKVIARRATKAKLKGVHPHILRDTFVAWRAAAGVPPYKLAAIMGLKIENLPGMHGIGSFMDAATLGAEARQTTPAWLEKLVREGR